MVPRQGNAMTEMPDFLIASTWSFITLCNGDATTIPRYFLFVWVSLPGTNAKFNFSQNPWEEPPQHPFAPVNSKQPGAALLWARICLKIVPNSGQSLHYDTKDNYGQHGQHKLVVWLHRKFTSLRRFQSTLLFMQITIVRVAVNAFRQWQTLLLAWRERDESLTWLWQDNRRSANGNLLFLGKASFSCSQRCPQTLFFLFSHHYPLALAVNKSPAVYILSPALIGLWKENKGSVNRLIEHSGLEQISLVV